MELAVGARVEHPKYGEGVVYGGDFDFYKVFFQDHGEKEIAREYDGMTVHSNGPEMENELSIDVVEDALRTVLLDLIDFTPMLPMAARWVGGTMELKPSDSSLSSKEIPLDTFFKKIVMLRDRLRVLEQSINSHKVLTEEDKVHLQQYITRCYGSLTTFNILFADNDHNFVGDSKKRGE